MVNHSQMRQPRKRDDDIHACVKIAVAHVFDNEEQI